MSRLFAHKPTVGLRPPEIGLIIGLVVFFLGAPRAGRLLGRLFSGWRQVGEVKARLRSPFSVKDFVMRRGRDWISKD